MIQPNDACMLFCQWMLNISPQRLSNSQRLIVTQVYLAARDQYPIEDQVWRNFNLFTAWRNPYYIVYRSYANSV